MPTTQTDLAELSDNITACSGVPDLIITTCAHRYDVEVTSRLDAVRVARVLADVEHGSDVTIESLNGWTVVVRRRFAVRASA